MTLVGLGIVFWVFAWWGNTRLARLDRKWVRFAVPTVFGVSVLVLWECTVRGLSVSQIILPAPSAIAARFVASGDVLWLDFTQTVVKGALSGYLIGAAAAFAIAIAVDRSSFLQRGLLPIGRAATKFPIVGIAPILVGWFGFDWHSKAAVVVVMVFFPILVNTVQGLSEASSIQRDLMRTYAAGYFATLFKLRIPAALPFIFNGLKVSATLALIGAIVAEYFGSPTRGMGFRISTEVGRLNIDMVWAEIVVAALAGSAFYMIVTLLERATTFWHPSQRG